MAIILENTPFSYAIDSAVKANKLLFVEKHPDSILINVPPTRGFSVGDTITYVGGSTRFSGRIWYIYKGSSSYNLYIKHREPRSLSGIVGGMVYPGTSISVTQPIETTGSASNVNHQAEAEEVLETPGGTVITGGANAPDPVKAEEKAMSLVNTVIAKARQYKTPLLIGAGVVVAIMIKKGMK